MFISHICSGCGMCPKYRAPRDSVSVRTLQNESMSQFGLMAKSNVPSLLVNPEMNKGQVLVHSEDEAERESEPAEEE